MYQNILVIKLLLCTWIHLDKWLCKFDLSKTEYFPAYIRTCPDEDMEDNNDAMKKVVTSIKKEAANLKIKNDCDFGQINYQSSTEATATTLLHLISDSIS